MTDTAVTTASRLNRLAGWSQRHHWAALASWVVLLVTLAFAAGWVGGAFEDDTALAGSESQRVADALAAAKTGPERDQVTIVVHRDAGLTGGAASERVTAMLAAVADDAAVASVSDPFRAVGSISGDGQTALATVTLSTAPAETDPADVRALISTAQSLEADGYQVELGGDAVASATESDGPSEGIGLLAAVLILVALFGSVLAGAMPLVTAVFAVGSAVGATVLLSHLLTVPTYATSMMALVGFGVGIDYALLVFVRYRQEIRRGSPRDEATRVALDTAGRSVLFAGVTVIIALLGMLTLRLGAFQGLALAVSLTVAATMAASLTLLPALLTLFGRRLEARIVRQRTRRRRDREVGEGWRAFARRVQRFPVLAVVGGTLVLLVLAWPALDLRLGFADAGTDAPGTTTRQAYDLTAAAFGAGSNGPLLLLTPSAADAESAASALGDVPGVASTIPHQPTETGVVVIPDTGPASAATADLVHRLREDVLPGLGEGYDLGGSVPAAIDFSDTVSGRLPWLVGTVVGLSALLLAGVFRSVLIPLKAAVANLLSIGAALGVMAFVFGDGHLGAPAGPIEAFLPVIVFAVVFGLSMDYEVFLISRVHEHWRRTADAAGAVREGLAVTGGVITAAAAIMVVVFGSFLFSGDRMLAQMGLGLSVAVLVDALIVRCLVVPAALELFGDRAWWLPSRLDAALPRIELESPAALEPRSGPGPAA